MSGKWLEHLDTDPTEWLIASNPWTKYRTLTDLLDVPANSAEIVNAKAELVAHPKILELIEETTDWMSKAPTRNNDPKITYYKLRMLADFGLTIQNDGIPEIVTKAIEHTEDGFFAARGELPQRAKKGQKPPKPDLYTDEWHACPCTSPIITYALLRLGYKSEQLTKSIEYLRDHWDNEQGWFCHFFFVNSMFKKLHIGCQMAGLMALEVFGEIPELKESEYARNAYEPLRFHREYGKTMYYFGRSNKFWTFKYPFVWYNALYLADVLTRFEFLKDEALVQELIDWIKRSQDEHGRFKPTSIFMPYRSWDFGNKKEPSPWITFLCCRILKRWYG